MSLSAEQINQIARILGRTKRFLNAHIENLGSDLTAQDETDIAVELARWETAGIDFLRIHPNLKNYGAEIDADETKADIRKNLAILLDLEASYSGIGTLQIGI